MRFINYRIALAVRMQNTKIGKYVLQSSHLQVNTISRYKVLKLIRKGHISYKKENTYEKYIRRAQS